jgi:hypothetical protein
VRTAKPASCSCHHRSRPVLGTTTAQQCYCPIHAHCPHSVISQGRANKTQPKSWKARRNSWLNLSAAHTLVILYTSLALREYTLAKAEAWRVTLGSIQGATSQDQPLLPRSRRFIPRGNVQHPTSHVRRGCFVSRRSPSDAALLQLLLLVLLSTCSRREKGDVQGAGQYQLMSNPSSRL